MTWIVPLPAELQSPRIATLELQDRHGKTLARIGNAEARECQPVARAEMGRWLPAVTVALEDHRFLHHGGVDFHALAGACSRAFRRGRIQGGASTITQQVIKQASGRRGRSVAAKVYEALAAWRLDREWSKAEILEAYLNRCDYGNRIVGAASAARVYFHKSPAQLSLSEAVYLAGLPQAPSRFNPWRHPAVAAARYSAARRRVETLGIVPENERVWPAAPPVPASEPRAPWLAPHFVAEIRSGSRELRGTVRTTLDLELQRTAEQGLRQQLVSLAGRGVSSGAVVIIEHGSGAIRALVGSSDFAHPRFGQINGATEPRHTGSILKPLLYAQGIDERKLTAATLLPDTGDAVRSVFPDYDPANYTPAHWGPVRVREALASSLNVPAVVALGTIGARRAFDHMAAWGVRFRRPFDETGAGFILGNAEASLLDVTAAFGVLAADGRGFRPRFLESDPRQILHPVSPEAAQIVCDILCDDTARAKGFSLGSPLAFAEARVPCKTGTSSSFRDTWTLGSTARHTVGVWLGNHNGRSMDELAAIEGAAPLWRSLVEELLKQDGGLHAPDAPGLVRGKICALTGGKPNSATGRVLDEWFIRGTGSDAKARLGIADGEWKLILPSEYAQWCQSPANFLGAIAEHPGPLRIQSPTPHGRYVFDDAIRQSQQAIALRATGMRALQWWVDGVTVASSESGLLWQMVRGQHSVRVTDGTESAEASFTVE